LKKPIATEIFVNEVVSFLKIVGVGFADRYEKDIQAIFQNAKRELDNTEMDFQSIYDANIWELDKSCANAERIIKKVTRQKIWFRRLFKSFKYNGFDGYNFRRLQSGCDEKFDLAKQTSIEYKIFCYYFYRYYSVIDEFIDQAYAKANQNRSNPEEIWKEIEQDFIAKTGAEIFY
jgi:hypothetical protein